MVTMDALQRGLQVVETVENSREALKQANSSMTEVLIGQKEAGDYLHFALALDEVRKYAAGKRFVPGFPIYEATQSLIKKMEELDSLIAGQRAGLPDRAENPFIFSQLAQSLETFASSIELNSQFKRSLRLESEEFELLRALESMRQRFELPEERSWKVLKTAVRTMKDPVQIDDGVIDDLKLHWTRKSRTAQFEALRRETLAGQESGRARLLLDSRKAALEEEKLRQSNSQVPDPSLSRPWLLYYSLVNELRRYLGKYEDSMDKSSGDIIKQRLSEVLELDYMMAGPDSDPLAVEPNAEKVEAYLTSTVWPNLVKHFGSYEPTSGISEGDSRLFRIMYELQNTLALPEKVDGADMRRIYNYTGDPDRQEEPWPDALKVAHVLWDNEKKRRSLLLDRQERSEKEKEPEEVKVGENPAPEKTTEEKLEAEKTSEEVTAEEEGPKPEDISEKDLNMTEVFGEGKAEEAPEALETSFVRRKKEADLFESIKQEAMPRVEDKLKRDKEREEQEQKEREEEKAKYKDPPSWEGKTWGAFAEELVEYLKVNVKKTEDIVPVTDNPRPKDYPHIGPISQFLVARNLFGSEELKNSIINPQELTREANAILDDPCFAKLLKDPEFLRSLAWRGASGAWDKLMEERKQAYADLKAKTSLDADVSGEGKTVEKQKLDEKQAAESRLDVNIKDKRKKQQDEIEEEMKPIRTAVERVYLRLTDTRYNADIQKTGFLFFKPSDTGFYQTAVKALETLYNKKEQYSNGELTAARQAVKAYLDERKDVRSHEYGKRRWEKMMCAYKALALPGQFEEYCKELNAYRGIKDTDTLNPNYVHSSAFGAERMDLVNPHVPMNEAYRQLRQDYAKAKAAGEKDALLDYFSKIAAIRTQAARINGDWGTLVDMNLVAEQAEMLRKDSGFINAFNKGKGESDRKAMFAEAGKILDPDSKNWEELRNSAPAAQQNKKTNEISKR